MPASFRLEKNNVDAIIRELKQVEPNLVKEFRAEFKSEIRPFANSLKTNIPPRSPLSGFSPRATSARDPYMWKKPSAKIDVNFRSRRRNRGEYSIVRILFSDKRPNSAFSILETAGTQNPGGITYRGANMIRGLAKRGYPLGNRGRWVIPQFYNNQAEITRKAVTILEKYTAKVNRRLRQG